MSDLERDLIERAKEGDGDAFEELVKLYQKKVYTTAVRMCKDEYDAYDVAQEVFIRVYRSLAGFRFDSSFSTYIYRITVNMCIDHIRKRKQHGDVDSLVRDTGDDEYTVEIVDGDPLPEEMLEARERAGILAGCISELPPAHREMITLRDINGLSYDEISAILGLPSGTVKSRINRARAALKTILIQNGNFFSDGKSNPVRE